jgi:hypothetical protein
MVPQVAAPNWVWRRPIRRSASSRDVGKGGEPEPELVRSHGHGRGAIGEQVELLLPDPVLDVAAGAVDVLVQGTGVDGPGGERGHDQARVCSLGQVLGFRHDAARPAPAVERAPEEVGEAAGRTAAIQALGLGRGQIVGDGADQALVTRQPEDVIDAMGLAPRHELVAGKARIGAQQDLHMRPGAELGYP